MAKRQSKKTTKKKKKSRSESTKLCFVISPIGKDGTDLYREFKNVLDYIIKPAVEESGYDLKVVRADDINQSGSIIKDILQSLVDSYVVIADLTGENPNVFYELGVRHALKPRTILISEKSEHIPFDLNDYRTIIYENSAKGVNAFKKKLKEYLDAMSRNPERSDNPVLDKLESIVGATVEELQNENAELKKRIDNLQKGKRSSKLVTSPERSKNLDERVDRIFKLLNAERQIFEGSFLREKDDGKKESFKQLAEQGNFHLYYVMNDDGNIHYAIYLSQHTDKFNTEEAFADIRVLLERNSSGQNMRTKFIIATNQDLSKEKKKLVEKFKKMLNFIPKNQRQFFSLELWDNKGLLRQERSSGLKL